MRKVRSGLLARLIIVALVLVAVAALPAAAGAQSRGRGHIVGIAQICGGYPGPCRGAATTVSVLTLGGQVVASKQTTTSGLFNFTLPTGVYKVVAAFGTQPSKVVTLRRNKTVHVTLSLDVP
jgi:hypothetical protein